MKQPEIAPTPITYLDTTYGLWGVVLAGGAFLIKALNKANKLEIDKINISITHLDKKIDAMHDSFREILELSLASINKDIHQIKNDQAAHHSLKNLIKEAETKFEHHG